MLSDKADIIAGLRKEILPLEGYKPLNGVQVGIPGLDNIEKAFPNGQFATGAIHEFLCGNFENTAASTGYILGLLSTLMRNGRICIWISNEHSIFPPAIAQFGISPDRIIFIQPRKNNEALWIMEEALKCDGLAAVIGDIKEIDFTASRRLQLAVEKSQVTGMLIRNQINRVNNSAALARWQIIALPSASVDGLPGIGYPKWKVNLLKVRNGKPGSWQIEWKQGRFNEIKQEAEMPQQNFHLKVG